MLNTLQALKCAFFFLIKFNKNIPNFIKNIYSKFVFKLFN